MMVYHWHNPFTGWFRFYWRNMRKIKVIFISVSWLKRDVRERMKKNVLPMAKS